MSNLCEFAEVIKENNAIGLRCKKSGNYCAFQRYCAENRCLEMRNNYLLCKARFDYEKEK